MRGTAGIDEFRMESKLGHLVIPFL